MNQMCSDFLVEFTLFDQEQRQGFVLANILPDFSMNCIIYSIKSPKHFQGSKEKICFYNGGRKSNLTF